MLKMEGNSLQIRQLKVRSKGMSRAIDGVGSVTYLCTTPVDTATVWASSS